MSHDRLLDLRHLQTLENQRDSCAMVKGKVVQRPIETVTGVTLHQTAAWYSVAKYQLKAAEGDEALARHMRALAINAPITAMRHGKFVVVHGPTDYVYHGHQLNETDLGLEHEGLYDADGNPVKKPPGVDVGEIIEAGRAALTWAVEQCPKMQWVDAHRQAMRRGARAKTSDPGAKIFREVGVEWGVKKLGLKIRPDQVWGAGKALPKNWYA